MQAVQRSATERQDATDISQRLQSDVRIIEQNSVRQMRELAERERALGSLQNKVWLQPHHAEIRRGISVIKGGLLANL